MLDDIFKKINNILGDYKYLSPEYHKFKFMTIEFGQDYEPHGKASENWEFYWVLTLPHIRYYWLSTNGWVVGDNPKLPISFKARTLEQCARQALDFLITIGPNPTEVQ